MAGPSHSESVCSESPPPSLGELFRAFVQVSLWSFGGSTTALIRQTLVKDRQWLTDAQFAEGLSISQVMPGPNALNVTSYLGYQLGGWPGAVTALLGLTAIPFLIVMALGLAYFENGSRPAVRQLLLGLGAAAAGVSFGTALNMASKHLKDPFFLVVASLVFLTQTVIHLHILIVVAMVTLIALLAPLPLKKRVATQ